MLFDGCKGLVLSALSEKWPLTAKQVFQSASKASGAKRASYQAVHKTLSQLAQESACPTNSKRNP